MHKDRIEFVINMLGSIKDMKWDYTGWAYDYEMSQEVEGMAIPACGTTACAAGWMGLSKICNADGFVLDEDGTPWFAGEYGHRAVAKYLGLDEDTAREIFVDLGEALDIPSLDVTPQHVAMALKALLVA